MLADQLDFVVGVDTHRDAHAFALIAAATGAVVLEVERPQRSERRQGKSDAIDARRAARAALGQTRLALPRAGGAREAIRCLKRYLARHLFRLLEHPPMPA